MRQASQEAVMTEVEKPDTEIKDLAQPAAEGFSARLIRREAERRAALELATSTPAGLESALARISAEVTAEAADAKAAKDR
jgi:hypothetical protein